MNSFQEFLIGLAVVVISLAIGVPAAQQALENLRGKAKSLIKALLWFALAVINFFTLTSVTMRGIGVPISAQAPISAEPIYRGLVLGIVQYAVNLWDFSFQRITAGG